MVATVVKTRERIRYIRYECLDRGCGNLDIGKFWISESIPPGISCSKCHAGVNLKPDAILSMRQGMVLRCEVDEDGVELKK
jgi:hypothetical protein